MKFDTVEAALTWAADQMRQQRQPGNSWDGVVKGKIDTSFNPHQHSPAPLAAQVIWKYLTALPHANRVLMEMQYLGDYWHPEAYSAALQHQAAARRQGVRVRVNYRYTYRQLAAIMKCDPKQVWRKSRESHQLIYGLMKGAWVTDMQKAAA